MAEDLYGSRTPAGSNEAPGIGSRLAMSFPDIADVQATVREARANWTCPQPHIPESWLQGESTSNDSQTADDLPIRGACVSDKGETHDRRLPPNPMQAFEARLSSIEAMLHQTISTLSELTVWLTPATSGSPLRTSLPTQRDTPMSTPAPSHNPCSLNFTGGLMRDWSPAANARIVTAPDCGPEFASSMHVPMTSTPSANVVRFQSVTSTVEEPEPATSVNKSTTYRPQMFDGTSPWREYMVHFESCAELNGWGEREKGLYLAVSLKGCAQQVLANVKRVSSRVPYDSLKSALEQRFAPPNQVDMYRAQLKTRSRKDGESLLELGQSLRRLVQLAYPGAESSVQETLAKEQFLDALVGTDLHFLIWQRKPKTLDEAVQAGVEIEAFQVADRNRKGLLVRSAMPGAPRPKGDAPERDAFLVQIEKMLNDHKRRPKLSPSQRRAMRTCRLCGKMGHWTRECPERNREYEKTPNAPREADQSEANEDQANVPKSDVTYADSSQTSGKPKPNASDIIMGKRVIDCHTYGHFGLNATEIKNDTSGLRELQNKDPDLKDVITWVQNDCRPTWNEVESYSANTKTLWGQFSRLEMVDGVLCVRWVRPSGSLDRHLAIVPQKLKTEVLRRCHEASTGKHLGVMKTISNVRKNYIWPGLQRDVRLWCKSCVKCGKRKNSGQKPPAPLWNITVDSPGGRVTVDSIGSLPTTGRGNRRLIKPKSRIFRPGEHVLLYSQRKTRGVSSKRQGHWEDGYIILEAIDDVTYRVQRDQRKPDVVHHDRLRLLPKRVGDLVEPQPGPEEVAYDDPEISLPDFERPPGVSKPFSE